MRTRRRGINALSVLAVAVLVAVSVGLSGCGQRRAAQEPTAPSVETTQAPAESTATSGEQAPKPEPIDASKAKALESELNSIDKELGGVQMPEDSTFNEAGSALE
ncbi:MAG: hypothetical protein C4521_13195 [Actinobacteria bacterium]|nr:MAG: hypothetical protein C4521_13195 [Actinomycetota bacterium]